MLRMVQRKDELLLSEHFSEGVRTVRKRLLGLPVRVINFDWHGMVKELREKGTVEGLWALLESIVSQVQSGFPSTPVTLLYRIRSWLQRC